MLRQPKVRFAPFRLKTGNFSLKRFSSNVVEPLNNKTLLRVSGAEVKDYLQGLITNDIEHLNSGPGSMYTAFLNSAGRLLYDAIIYRKVEPNVYLIECDVKASDLLQKYMKLYRVRRKIDISHVGDELKVYALFNTKSDELPLSDGQELSKPHEDVTIFRDPRIAELGSRIIAPTEIKITDHLDDVCIKDPQTERNYRWLRYSLGVGEGVEDLPPGDCFPLECNCDYLHGVSFHKGCYIGQELTARVHHTGVVRKRLMPIHFTKIPSNPPEKIVQDKVNLGKLRGVENDVGLASLRIEKTLAFKEIKLGDGIFVTAKPKWWPCEAPKEKANISKLQ